MAATEQNFLRVLVDPVDSNIDIIAVHGLNPINKKFHAEATWTADNKKLWLLDFLPRRLPRARILLFGYNSNVAVETSAAGVNEQAVNLLDRLDARRRQVNAHRAIIFIAHSLGGLVVKRALVEAKLNDKYGDIRRATFGLVFFATPHRGGNHARLGDIAAKIARSMLWAPSNSFMDNLNNNSLLSEYLQDEFKHQYEDYQILSFYETLAMGPLGLIVDKHSATLGLSGQRETAIGVEADHRGICKFAEPNAAYEQVEDNLVALVEQALLAPGVQTAAFVSIRLPIFLVPYQRNAAFVGRGQISERLTEILAPHPGWQRRAALYGLGGIGKTQIALSYAHWCGEAHPGASVFWVHASNLERLHQSFMDLAQDLQIPGADSPKIDVFTLVKNWLSIKAESGNWLMIVDNADDYDMLFKPSKGPRKGGFSGRLADYIPDCAHGAVLITTRDKKVAIGMVKKMSSLLHVRRMIDSEARDLVRKVLEDDEQYQEDDIEDLAKKLEHIPLALTQAAAFMWENTIDIPTYLRLYEASRVNALDLLGRSAANCLGDDDARNAVTTTWMMSFTQINKQNPKAADILALMAFLDRHCIPDDLIRKRDKTLSDMDFQTACGLLKRFSLIEESPLHIHGQVHAAFSLHGMVQLVTQQWVHFHGQTAMWTENALVAVSIVFPPGEREEWKSCEIYLPHVEVVLDGKAQTEDESVSAAKGSLLHNAATYFRVKGYHGRAEETAIEAVAVRTASLGEGNPNTLASKTNLSRILLEQGKVEEAKKLQVEAVATAKKSVPDDNADMLRAVAHLAALHGIQQQYEEAEKLQLQVLEASKRTQGLDQPDTLLAMRDLAVTYGYLGRYDEAEELNHLVLNRRKRRLGEDHPETLISMLDLAATYGRQDPDMKAKQAEDIELQVIEARKRVLGEEHPATVQAMEHLCGTYEWQGRWDEAHKLQEEIRTLGQRGCGQASNLASTALLTMSQDIVTYKLPLRAPARRMMTRVDAHHSTDEAKRDETPDIRKRRTTIDLTPTMDRIPHFTEPVEAGAGSVTDADVNYHHLSPASSFLRSPGNDPAAKETEGARSILPGFRTRWKSWQGLSSEESQPVAGKPRKKGWTLKH